MESLHEKILPFIMESLVDTNTYHECLNSTTMNFPLTEKIFNNAVFVTVFWLFIISVFILVHVVYINDEFFSSHAQGVYFVITLPVIGSIVRAIAWKLDACTILSFHFYSDLQWYAYILHVYGHSQLLAEVCHWNQNWLNSFLRTRSKWHTNHVFNRLWLFATPVLRLVPIYKTQLLQISKKIIDFYSPFVIMFAVALWIVSGHSESCETSFVASELKNLWMNSQVFIATNLFGLCKFDWKLEHHPYTAEAIFLSVFILINPGILNLLGIPRSSLWPEVSTILYSLAGYFVLYLSESTAEVFGCTITWRLRNIYRWIAYIDFHYFSDLTSPGEVGQQEQHPAESRTIRFLKMLPGGHRIIRLFYGTSPGEASGGYNRSEDIATINPHAPLDFPLHNMITPAYLRHYFE